MTKNTITTHVYIHLPPIKSGCPDNIEVQTEMEGLDKWADNLSKSETYKLQDTFTSDS